MGGYFSTRWNAEHTRADTDAMLSLDLADIRKMGGAAPGAVATVTWTNARGETIGAIQTAMSTTRDTLTLTYRKCMGDGDWQNVRDHIGLEATPCTYGGERLWFTCPGCQSRRRVLFGKGGSFRCRACHDLAYTSTREDMLGRSQRRTRRHHKQLNAGGAGIYDLPAKPDGMHWRTYERIAGELLEERTLQLRTIIGERERLHERVDKLTR